MIPKKENKEFSILEEEEEEEEDSKRIPIKEFPILKLTKLENLETIQFPFTTDTDDYFILKLKNKEIIINQYNGNIIHEYGYGSYSNLYNISYNIHTGKGNVLWSIILCISSISILFFIISGFKIASKRLFSKGKNIIAIEDSNILILVGSENGSTMYFARQFYNELIEHKKKVHIESMNNYKRSLKAKKIIVMTSTYGNGDAPTNASKFMKKFMRKPINGEFQYAVIGFGSTFYPSFCQYAKDVNTFLASFKSSKCVTPIFLVNNRSIVAYNEWKKKWKIENNISLETQ